MVRLLGVDADVDALERLSGGANLESWSFDYGGQGFILRRAPNAGLMEGRSFGHDVEVALVERARQQGVMAPEVIGELTHADALGSGYIMRRIAGEVNPTRILASPAEQLIADLARQLALIHMIKPDPALALPLLEPAIALAEMKKRFLDHGGDRPIIALAIRWCETHLPEPVAPVLVHGDFRMGNVIVDAGRLQGVLDWELAHWGDSHEDLAYGCLAVWRFGHFDRPAFGCASLHDYFILYERYSGQNIDKKRFQFWMVYRTLWWALGCLQMAHIWRSGTDPSLERAVIGKRTSENELDLLMLIESEAPEIEKGPVAVPKPRPARQLGEPSMSELLGAVRDWIGTDVKPHSEGRAKFMAAVAMNAVGIVIREQDAPCDPYDKALAQALLSGEQSLATPGLLARLRVLALSKAANDSPKYATLAAARAAWLRD
jgi:aminoglycoside phosphotransferase (APT) family kinase protein